MPQFPGQLQYDVRGFAEGVQQSEQDSIELLQLFLVESEDGM